MNNVKMLPSLLIFAEVAKQQSFTLAAKQLGMSKSTVSQHVKRLETQIGQQLLSRHTRGMALTAAGEKLLSRCELLQDQVNLAFAEIDSSKEAPSGVFAITIPHSLEREIVIPALNQLCIEFVNIEPRILVSDQMQDLIKNNLDVALSFGELKDSHYRALPVGVVGESICASSVYVQRYGLAKTVEDLQQHRWIPAPWQKQQLAIYENNATSKKIDVNVKFAAQTNTLPTALEMVLNDMGMALLPEFFLQTELASGRLVRVMQTHQGKQWPLYMVHRFQADKPIHVSRFYQLVKHFFNKANS
ncbi:LysR family transcriptional regulator [Colwelliaceae bacterium BS250]